ncbi:MAG TPA: AEC family transporter [Alphaproteobacteria bacterium]|nr:AEC family transporter [Alphaproteobacteria bacterium]
MPILLDIVLPVFGLIAIGWIAGRRGVVAEAGMKGLNDFVFFFAIPALLFRAMAKEGLPAGADARVLVSYFGGCYASFGLGLLAARLLFRLPLTELAVFGMGAMFSNTVLLGLPLIGAAYGDRGLVTLLLIIAFNSLLLFTLTTLVYELGRGQGTRLGATLAETLRALAKNPIILSLFAGLAWHAAGLGLPQGLDRFLGFLGGAAAPTALFALGVSLTGFRLAGDLPQAGLLVAFKLLVHPAITWVLASRVFGLDPLVVAVATVVAALPTGSNVYMFAARYGTYERRAASAILLSTALAVVTVSLLLAWLPR